MSNWLKVAIAVGGALLVGLIIGYIIGVSGKGELKTAAQSARDKQSAAERRAKEAGDTADKARKRVRRRVALLRGKEQLFRALLQLKSSNFGIAGQHLSHASTQLKKAARLGSPSLAKRIKRLRAGLASAHAKTMGLDPVAQVQIETLINQVHQLPGAR
jgi:hypothetical protein